LTEVKPTVKRNKNSQFIFTRLAIGPNGSKSPSQNFGESSRGQMNEQIDNVVVLSSDSEDEGPIMGGYVKSNDLNNRKKFVGDSSSDSEPQEIASSSDTSGESDSSEYIPETSSRSRSTRAKV